MRFLIMVNRLLTLPVKVNVLELSNRSWSKKGWPNEKDKSRSRFLELAWWFGLGHRRKQRLTNTAARHSGRLFNALESARHSAGAFVLSYLRTRFRPTGAAAAVGLGVAMLRQASPVLPIRNGRGE